MREWSEQDEDDLRDRWAAGERMGQIARALGRTRGSICGKSNRLNLHFHPGKQRPLAQGSSAEVEARTVFTSTVQEPPLAGILKPGSYQRKLGGWVTKGRWKGFPIFSLTLEERATCPRSCSQWLSCYGNAMGRSVRYQHGDGLEAAVHRDLVAISQKHPVGFVVRLHILGDFFSIAYVNFWAAALDEFPGLNVFGYTARQQSDPIGAAIANLRRERWARFAVRTSGANAGPRTMVIEADAKLPGVIVCPAQRVSRKSISCGTCTLCWANGAQDKPIAFIGH